MGDPETAPVVCVGTATLDTIALVDRMPGPDERIVAEEIRTAGGGPAATAAVTLARLGIPVEFAGVVGADPAGGRILDGLTAEGVGVRMVERRRGVDSAQSMILVSAATATRAIVTRPAPVPRTVPAGFAWTHVDHTGYPALRAAGRLPGRVGLDDGNAVAHLDLALIDLYVPTATVLTGRFGGPLGAAARSARQAGAAAVVVTDGAAGSVAADGTGTYRLAGLAVPVRSTLGAGDVFHGALLAALVEHATLPEAARFANACAALSCRGLDGRGAIPTRAEIHRALAELPAPVRENPTKEPAR